MTIKNKQQGFTIVELLIVIVVIGILAALVITTFTGIQQKARDTERQTDIKALQGQVEAYYAQKGNYPTRTNVNDSAWRSTNMKGLDAEAIKDPKNPTGTTPALAAAVSATQYRYDVLNASDTSCEADETTCVKYTLEADMEQSGVANYSKTNLN
jgi:prepilin-type N-terminal cleavage/methylation domain-containing protein